jgi:hypothetical protein
MLGWQGTHLTGCSPLGSDFIFVTLLSSSCTFNLYETRAIAMVPSIAFFSTHTFTSKLKCGHQPCGTWGFKIPYSQTVGHPAAWLFRHYATSQKVAGSIPDEVTGFLT